MADINLLPVEARDQENFSILVKRISIVSVVVLVITGIVTFIILVLFSSFSSKRSKLVASVEASSWQIESLKSTEELIVVVKDKASSAEKLVSSRTDFADIFENISKLIPQGVYFTDAKFTSGKVSLSARAQSSADVAGLVSSLLSSEGAKYFNQVSIDSLSSNELGLFTFNITAQLVNKK